jgi:hypothetical protein
MPFPITSFGPGKMTFAGVAIRTDKIAVVRARADMLTHDRVMHCRAHIRPSAIPPRQISFPHSFWENLTRRYRGSVH